MREILFRGKDKDSGKWVYGYYVCLIDDEGKTHPQHRIYLTVSETEVAGIEGYDRVFYPNYHIVDPETVGQSTGILDKFGKPIFEGDIVKTDLERPYNIVIFRNGCFLFNCNDGGEDYVDTIENLSSPDVAQDSYWEVIGNIYDNKELCKKQ